MQHHLIKIVWGDQGHQRASSIESIVNHECGVGSCLQVDNGGRRGSKDSNAGKGPV